MWKATLQGHVYVKGSAAGCMQSDALLPTSFHSHAYASGVISSEFHLGEKAGHILPAAITHIPCCSQLSHTGVHKWKARLTPGPSAEHLCIMQPLVLLMRQACCFQQAVSCLDGSEDEKVSAHHMSCWAWGDQQHHATTLRADLKTPRYLQIAFVSNAMPHHLDRMFDATLAVSHEQAEETSPLLHSFLC